jgi:hypothetical protein
LVPTGSTISSHLSLLLSLNTNGSSLLGAVCKLPMGLFFRLERTDGREDTAHAYQLFADTFTVAGSDNLLPEWVLALPDVFGGCDKCMYVGMYDIVLYVRENVYIWYVCM